MSDQQNVGANLSKLLIKETGRLFQMKRNMEGYLQHRLPRPSVLPDISIKIAEGKKDLGSIFDDLHTSWPSRSCVAGRGGPGWPW